MLALHGLDVVGLEVSAKGAETARAYAESELKDPHDYNFGSPGSVPGDGTGSVQVIAGDFFKRDWEASAVSGDGFDLIYDYTVSSTQTKAQCSMLVADDLCSLCVSSCARFTRK